LQRRKQYYGRWRRQKQKGKETRASAFRRPQLALVRGKELLKKRSDNQERELGQGGEDAPTKRPKKEGKGQIKSPNICIPQNRTETGEEVEKGIR